MAKSGPYTDFKKKKTRQKGYSGGFTKHGNICEANRSCTVLTMEASSGHRLNRSLEVIFC